jgi:hypothetical protein
MPKFHSSSSSWREESLVSLRLSKLLYSVVHIVNGVGRVARSSLSLCLTEWPKQRTIRAVMQLKLGIKEATPTTPNNSAARYNIVVLCNKCGRTHEMTASVILKDGPIEKQSIADLYDGKTLPKNLADLTSRSVSCPQTGKQSIQKNNHQIFLVPAKN